MMIMIIIINFYITPNSIRNIFFSAVNTICCKKEKSSRNDYSSEAIENKNVFNLDLKISMPRETQML